MRDFSKTAKLTGRECIYIKIYQAIKEGGNQISPTDKEFNSLKMVKSMKEIGPMVRKMGMDSYSLKMAAITRALFAITSFMGRVNITGIIRKHTKVNGSIMKKVDLELWNGQMETDTKGSSVMTKLMVGVNFMRRTAASMKAVGKMVVNREFLFCIKRMEK